MTGQRAGRIADFCAELQRLVRACDIQLATIGRAINRSNSAVSTLLSGQRKTVPEWEDVKKILQLCAERGAPPELNLDVKWWRKRYAELVRGVEREDDPPPEPRPTPDPAPRLDAAACAAMDPDEAVRLLAHGRPEFTQARMHLLDRRLHGDHPYVLDALLNGFPKRVRAAHGVLRGALLRAAEVVLGEAVRHCGVLPPRLHGSDFVRLLAQEVIHGDGLEAGHLVRERVALMSGSQPDPDRPVRMDLYGHCLQVLVRLAALCPEFALTVTLPGTRVHDSADGPGGTGLAGLEALLLEFAGRQEPLAAGRARLYDSIAPLDSPGLRLPSLAQGYVNPRFRPVGGSEHADFQATVASDKWWEQQPSYETIEHFFAGYLLGLPALFTPLVVLGDPGAGKSLLTKLLTARLPASEFRPLRVELRHAPADKSIQRQLEHALELATGRPVSWPDWSEAEPGVTPVVLLDGFDELLQAGAQRLDSGRQWGYLREVEDFQRREAGLGRPLIVIVTSRTVVADRAEIPRDSQVLRLEPFGEPEIERWLDIWNTTNTDRRGRLRPLTLEAVLPHGDLAAQPLLLLMLALYDSVGDAPHGLREKDISRTQLYERLLTGFVRRQVEKECRLPAAEQGAAVERELDHLSVIALGMFHRGAQAISGEEADRDLRALGDSDYGSGLLFGRFFFVHEAQAVVTEERLRSYEFMHATFGEHLAARRIERALRGLLASDPHTTSDDGELYALLSFTPLSDRAQLLQNLREMLAAWSSDRPRTGLVAPLIRLFRAAAWDPERREGAAHVPVRQTRAYRNAVYEANLLMVMVLAAPQVYASQLVGGEGDPSGGWRRHAMGWQAQLSPESWNLLCSTLTLERSLLESGPDLLISMRPVPLVNHALGWLFPSPTPLPEPLEDRLSATDTSGLIRRLAFTQDRDTDLVLELSYPLLLQLPGSLTASRETAGFAAQSLVALLTRDLHNPNMLRLLYGNCLLLSQSMTRSEAVPYLEAVVRQLVHDIPALPDEPLGELLFELWQALRSNQPTTEATEEAVLRCVRQVVERGSPELVTVLGDLRRFFAEKDRDFLSLPHLTRLGHSTHAWRWSGSPRGEAAARNLDSLLTRLDVQEVAATRPSAVIDILRLAAELDLGDWLKKNAAPLLDALPAHAFGLLRPSDLRPLRAALPEGAYAKEFDEVQWAWRAPTPLAETPPPHSLPT